MADKKHVSSKKIKEILKYFGHYNIGIPIYNIHDGSAAIKTMGRESGLEFDFLWIFWQTNGCNNFKKIAKTDNFIDDIIDFDTNLIGNIGTITCNNHIIYKSKLCEHKACV